MRWGQARGRTHEFPFCFPWKLYAPDGLVGGKEYRFPLEKSSCVLGEGEDQRAYSVWLVAGMKRWNQTNQRNQINQTDEIDQIDQIQRRRVIPPTGHAERALVPAHGRIAGMGQVLRRVVDKIVRWLGR